MLRDMRTTVTLDPDLAAKLRALARERGVSFKEALNSALRRGLASGEPRGRRRYRVASRPLGLRPGVDLEHALRLAGELDDAETIRKLELRK
jgi:Ribbon-helix-helix protein, copG family